jgi:hypothetical protein
MIEYDNMLSFMPLLLATFHFIDIDVIRQIIEVTTLMK